MTATATAAGPAPPLSWFTKIFYPLGSAANGIKQRSVTAFTLLYYNQVLGLPPAVVGTVLMVVALFDGLCDPVVGQISDNFRHRLGRRHPFLYAAIIPVPVAFFLMWNPPGDWSHAAMAGWLLACLLVIRLFDTFFELPSAALLPELTSDYQERTTLAMGRSLSSNIAGLLASVAAYQYFMRENADGTGGMLDRAGYLPFSAFFAVVMFTIMLTSAISTHKRIPYLRKPPPKTKKSLAVLAREVGTTLWNRSFIALATAQMLLAVAMGVRVGLELYFSVFFWGLTQAQLAALTTTAVVGGFLGAALALFLSRTLGKKKALLVACACAILTLLGPITLRLMGLMPENGSPLLFYILMADMLLFSSTQLAMQIVLMSAYADVVEDAEVKTGRRSEGLILSADNLFRKMVASVGVFLSGLVLTLVSFPVGAERGQVPAAVLQHMGWVYVPILGTVLIGAFIAFTLFRLDEATHRSNLDRLRETAAP